ncbi:MAG: hypothetical protein KW802_03745 [Candidatus Doudnabacteria bacterium]|nr:hypothetical protein [Candidatus Doudnabacteria bacterium]
MAKTKSRKFHKIRIHHNRWLMWALAYFIFVAIALLGYLKIANLDLESSVMDFQPMHSYTDKRLGFALRYPADWSIEAANASISFVPSNTADDGVNVSVTTPNQESSIRRTLKIKKEVSVTFNAVTATKLTNDLGNGHYETVILAPYNKKLYVIRGTAQLVDNLAQTFIFVK